MDKVLDYYEPVVGENAISQLRQLARDLQGARVVHVNSTRVGGGVAEILGWLVPLMEDLGLDTSWEIVEGAPEFYQITKSFLKALQGNKVPLTRRMLDTYEKTSEENAERLRPTLEDADFVFIHDPQPAALFDLCPNRKGIWVWRCHIDVSHPNRKYWTYLRSRVSQYHASIFSMPEFAQSLPHPQFLIAPSIDPLSQKNCELVDGEVSSTLMHLGIPSDLPILTQISRFDRFKDPVGVIEAFDLLGQSTPARLVLAGGGATDDPEGAAVLKEVRDAANGNGRIHILELPSDAHRTINALQRASTLVIQKSTKEGFGLTVTEALWKSKPVIGGNVGGIRQQVHNHHTGYLVNSPQGAALRVQELLRNPVRIRQIGERATKFVKENYLLNRHLREYLTLMLGVRRGLTNHLMTN
ncbi:MAG: glycosyl transferase family 1 [Candidatus Zixiibacteriota bacterium]|nr:MAG: glycosyl transferase family 1 [candidate division Zixibacteria bacterium]